jgi:hypothetical protein
LTVLFASITIAYFVKIYQPEHEGLSFGPVMTSGNEIRSHFESVDADPKIVEYDDGVIAYTTGFQTLSGKSFALDMEAARAFESGELLSLAHDRGYRYIASHAYMPVPRFKMDWSSDHIREVILGTAGAQEQDLSGFEFSVEFVEQDGKTGFIRFDRSQPEGK